MKKIKLLFLTLIISCLCFFVMGTNKVFAYSEQSRIADEVQDLIDDEVLPSWHSSYKNYPYYQTVYLKYKNSTSSTAMTYFASLSETRLRQIFSMYLDDMDEWMDLLSKLNLDTSGIAINQTLGIQFDGQFLYLIWTSDYIPNELLTLRSVTYEVNGTITTVTNNQISGKCSHINGDAYWDLSDHCYIMSSGQDVICQINKTPIMSYHVCETTNTIYGIGCNLEGIKNFRINGWTAEIDHIQKTTLDDPTCYYTFNSEGTAKEFSLSEGVVYGGKAFYQMTSHVAATIKDCCCQSIYDLNFGGYKHYVYFNTNIELDKIYRVDTAYTLLADDEIWAAKLITGVKSQTVKKSLTEDKSRGGFLNLSRYQGLTEGDFASNDNDSKHYRYRLMLNYDESNWELSEMLATSESDYKRVDSFYALRLNYLCDGIEQESGVVMDAIEGENLKCYNRDLILDTSSAIWNFKETTFEVADTTKEVIEDTSEAIKDVVEGATNIIEGTGDAVTDITGVFSDITSNTSKVKKTILITLGSVLGIVLIYGIYKGVIFVKAFLGTKNNKNIKKGKTKKCSKK